MLQNETSDVTICRSLILAKFVSFHLPAILLKRVVQVCCGSVLRKHSLKNFLKFPYELYH